MPSTRKSGLALLIGAVVSVAVHVVALLGVPSSAASAHAAPPPVLELIAVAPPAAGPISQPIADSPRAASASSVPVELPQHDVVRDADTDVGHQVPVAETHYVPAEQLTQRPAAVGAVDVPYPDVLTEAQAITVVLTLYINERGTVDRVEVEESGEAPSPFIDAARTAFGSARFSPGRDENTDVKSQLRIAVDFTAPDPMERQAPSALVVPPHAP